MAASPTFTLKLFTLFLTAACAVLCVLVIKLSGQVGTLRAQLAAAPTTRSPDPLVIGDVLPSLTARGHDGSPTPDEPHNLLNLTDGRLATVLVALGTACPTCEDHLPEFDALAAQYRDAGIVVTGIQIDTSKPAELKPARKFLPLAYVQASHTTWLRRIPLVPSVLVFDDRGTLRAQFIGTMSPEQNDELKALLAKALKAWN